LARKINNLFHHQKISLIRIKKNNKRQRKPQQGKATKKKFPYERTTPKKLSDIVPIVLSPFSPDDDTAMEQFSS